MAGRRRFQQHRQFVAAPERQSSAGASCHSLGICRGSGIATQEFAERGPIAKTELLSRFDKTVKQADAVLAALPAAQLLETRRYQMLAGEVAKTLLAIIINTLVHLGGHTQEIVALTRLQLRERYRFQRPQASPR